MLIFPMSKAGIFSYFILFQIAYSIVPIAVFSQNKQRTKTEVKTSETIQEVIGKGIKELNILNFESTPYYLSLEELLQNKSSVVKLDLRKNNLSEIPSDLAEFVNLEYLDLSYNNIATLSGVLTKMSHLKEIHLENNTLEKIEGTGVFPSSTVSLYLSNNKVTSLNAAILDLKDLEMLFLQNNAIQNLPSSIDQLSKLRYLYLYNNQLTALPNEICNLKNLQVLFIQHNNITELPGSFKKLKNLQYYEGPKFSFDEVSADNNNNTINADINAMPAMDQLYANNFGTSSTVFNTQYPSGFRPYKGIRTFFQIYYFPITGIHWLISKKFRTKMRYTKVYRLERRIKRLEESTNPKFKKIENKKNKRARVLNKI